MRQFIHRPFYILNGCAAAEEAEAGMAEMSKVYDGADGAQAPDANDRSEDKPSASYIWARVIGNSIESPLDRR